MLKFVQLMPQIMSHLVVWSSLLVCFILVIDCKMCKPSEYSIQTKEGKNKCVRCEECPPGMELTHSCGNRTPYPADVKIECIECKNGTFSIDQSSKACRQCSPECAKNEEERDKCLPTQNRFCKCRSGLYRDTGTNKCTKECCYCEQSDIEVEDCANREDGRRCGSDTTDGKCAIKTTSHSFTKTTSHSFTKATTTAAPLKKNGSENRDWIIGIAGCVFVLFLTIWLMYYFREHICNELRYCFASESSADGLGQDNVAREDIPLVSRTPSLEDILNATDVSCVEGCYSSFTHERASLLTDVTGSNKVTLDDQFHNVLPMRAQEELRKIAQICELRNIHSINNFEILLQSFAVSLPQLTLRSFVFLLQHVGRKDMVNTIHNMYHERRV